MFRKMEIIKKRKYKRPSVNSSKIIAISLYSRSSIRNAADGEYLLAGIISG